MKKELVKGMALAIGAASFASALAPRITMAESTAGLSSEDISALLPIIAAAVAVVAYVSISMVAHHIKNRAKQHEAGMMSIDLMRLQRILVGVWPEIRMSGARCMSGTSTKARPHMRGCGISSVSELQRMSPSSKMS